MASFIIICSMILYFASLIAAYALLLFNEIDAMITALWVTTLSALPILIFVAFGDRHMGD